MGNLNVVGFIGGVVVAILISGAAGDVDYCAAKQFPGHYCYGALSYYCDCTTIDGKPSCKQGRLDFCDHGCSSGLCRSQSGECGTEWKLGQKDENLICRNQIELPEGLVTEKFIMEVRQPFMARQLAAKSEIDLVLSILSHPLNSTNGNHLLQNDWRHFLDEALRQQTTAVLSAVSCNRYFPPCPYDPQDEKVKRCVHACRVANQIFNAYCGEALNSLSQTVVAQKKLGCESGRAFIGRNCDESCREFVPKMTAEEREEKEVIIPKPGTNYAGGNPMTQEVGEWVQPPAIANAVYKIVLAGPSSRSGRGRSSFLRSLGPSESVGSACLTLVGSPDKSDPAASALEFETCKSEKETQLFKVVDNTLRSYVGGTCFADPRGILARLTATSGEDCQSDKSVGVKALGNSTVTLKLGGRCVSPHTVGHRGVSRIFPLPLAAEDERRGAQCARYRLVMKFLLPITD